MHAANVAQVRAGRVTHTDDPDGKWILIDNDRHLDRPEDSMAPVDPAGVPHSLSEALQDWLGMSSTPDEDTAEFVGWSVEEVSRHHECS
ncbi:hypothetical protein [Streptomyces sp. NPDC058579]|uniref:hypothetical protein n=1 Tax=Streptomyces sp. NPDC058579 TaxID=3346548 RepID=UPI0036601B35